MENATQKIKSALRKHRFNCNGIISSENMQCYHLYGTIWLYYNLFFLELWGKNTRIQQAKENLKIKVETY